MLTRAKLEDVKTYGDFAYELAMDKTRSCYPAYYDGIKTRDDFLASAIEAVNDEHSELLLLFSMDGKVEGWIQYYWLEEDRYLQLTGYNIVRETECALKELLGYLEERFSGYSMYFGFPAENIPAQKFLAEHGFTCLERVWNNTLLFQSYATLPECGNVKLIDRDCFADFRSIHQNFEADIYWTCDRIYEALDRWSIFVYYQAKKPKAAIFTWTDGKSCEIFGLETLGDHYEKASRALITAALNHCNSMKAENMTFLCDDDVLPAVQKLGFDTIGQYTCWMKKLP